jgi:ligand-binding SRPBCC domain-containing protein
MMSTPPICTARQRDGMFRLTTTVLLPDTAERVFQFLSDTNNLEIVLPPWLGLRTLSPRPIDMGIATRIDYRFRIHGVPARWESEVTSWEPPRRFVYEQRRGPFRYWMHEHTFLDCKDGTMARDNVDYAVPGGRLVHSLFVRRDLERVFRYRRAQLIRTFGARY